MKILTVILFVFLTITVVNGQVVPSNCIAHDSVISQYKNDADRLAVQGLYSFNPLYKDSVSIPKEYSKEILKLLLAVYNAKNLPARDSVVSMFNIHSYGTEMNSFLIAADTNLSWVQQLKQRKIPTGDKIVDSLISLYNLRIHSYYTSSSLEIIYFTSDSNYNIRALTKIFSAIPGIKYSRAAPIDGEGDGIRNTEYTDHNELTYYYGWGDCPSGCIYGHAWVFNVYPDCSVEFVGGYGNSLEPEYYVFPNPFNSYISIQNVNEGSYQSEPQTYCIYDIYGRKLLFGDCKLWQPIENSGGLPSGFYILTLESKGHTKSFKIIKSEQ